MPRIPIMFGSALAAIIVLTLVIDVEAQGPGGRRGLGQGGGAGQGGGLDLGGQDQGQDQDQGQGQGQGQGGRGGRGGFGGGPGGFGGGFGGGPGGFGGGPGGWGGRGGPGGGSLGLIANKSVQDELKLTDKQKDQVKKASATADKMRQDLMAKMPRRGRGNQNQNQDQQPQVDEDGNPVTPPTREEIQEAFQSLQEESEGALGKILKKEQRTRFNEIELQRAGTSAFTRPEVIERLGLDELQQGQIEEVMSDSREMSMELFRGMRENMPPPPLDAQGQFDRAAMKARMETPEAKKAMETMRKSGEKIQSDTMTAILKVLYKPQKNNFNKMIGKPFDLSTLDNGGGPFGRRPNPPADAKSKDATKTDESKDAAPAKKGTRKGASKKKAAAG